MKKLDIFKEKLEKRLKISRILMGVGLFGLLLTSGFLLSVPIVDDNITEGATNSSLFDNSNEEYNNYSILPMNIILSINTPESKFLLGLMYIIPLVSVSALLFGAFINRDVRKTAKRIGVEIDENKVE